MSVCARGSSQSGMALPRSPRAITTTSASGRISSSRCSPVMFSILAKIFNSSAPVSRRAARTVRRSSAPRTKGCMSAVTPYSLARLRFSISISVSALAGSSRPATARLLWDRSTPPRSTRQVIARASRTRRESAPSSSSSSSPSCRFPVRIGGTGKASPSVSVSPSRSVSGAKSAPTRSSGPCRSMSKSQETPSAVSARRRLSSHGARSARGPWERFKRTPRIPARSRARSVSVSAQAGPSVP